jgi:hypothetical protein
LLNASTLTFELGVSKKRAIRELGHSALHNLEPLDNAQKSGDARSKKCTRAEVGLDIFHGGRARETAIDEVRSTVSHYATASGRPPNLPMAFLPGVIAPHSLQVRAFSSLKDPSWTGDRPRSQLQ